jgi:hypothetical protein
MIHNSSSDPVLIKKISLKIWSLRDEIEFRIQEKLDAGEMIPESIDEKITEIRAEYTKKSPIPDNIIALKSSSELPSEEDDEMAKAMAAAMAGEGNDEVIADEVIAEAAEAPVDGEIQETSNVIGMNGATLPPTSPQPNLNTITIGIEAPKLSEEKISKGKTILAEIGMEKMLFFSNRAFTEGQSVVIQFCIPKTFIMNADVVYCRPFNLKSRIISLNNYSHRMLIKFNFLKEGERALLRQFIQSIEPDLTKVVKKSAKEDASSDAGDFDELDDLGL